MKKTIKVNVIVGSDKIVAAIESACNRGAKLDKEFHKIAVSIATHINEYHEISLMESLFEKFPKGSRVVAMQEWFAKYAKVDYDKETKTWSPKRSEAMDLTEAIQNPWYDFKTEKPFQAPSALADILQKQYTSNLKARLREELTADQTKAIDKNIGDIKVAAKALGVTLEELAAK